jgi:hypothetical protein
VVITVHTKSVLVSTSQRKEKGHIKQDIDVKSAALIRELIFGSVIQ